MMHPLVEDGAKKIAPLFGRDREVGQLATLLHARRQRQPVGTLHHALHHGRELNVMAPYVLEEMVEVEGIVGIEVVDHGQRVPLHAVLVQQVDTLHHLAKGGAPGGRPAVFVVKLLRPVDGDPHQEIVGLEKLTNSSVISVPLVWMQLSICRPRP